MVDSKSSGSRRFIVIALCAIVVIVLVVTLPLTLRDKNDDDGNKSSASSMVPGQEGTSNKNKTACDIYCQVPILHAVQMTIKGDGKSFVDMPMKDSPTNVYNAFADLQKQAEPNDLTVSQLQDFLDKYFDEPGSDLKNATLSDYQAVPTQLDKIQNTTLREWALALNDIWKLLGREPVIDDPERHSYLPAKHPLVVPGGRFRESYYWDSYWIVQGLLASGMVDTARGVTQNLLDWVDSYGFVPNGGRIYYLTRSQPPVLSEMVRVLHEMDPQMDWLESATATLDKEYEFWMTEGEHGHAVTVKNHKLNRYVTATETPRPESYKEDVSTAQNTSDPETTYSNLRAAAESGWDFSSRWLEDQKNLATIMTSQIIPVDLNAILHRMEKNLMNFHRELGHSSDSDKYSERADKRQAAMDDVLWSEDDSMWRDYNTNDESMSPVIAASNFYPLWSSSWNTTNMTKTNLIVESLLNSGLIQEHAILTTTRKTEQQWDSPNAWPPIQDIIVEGLLQVNTTNATDLANSLIQRWVRTGLDIWTEHQVMVEKYDGFTGEYGNGGEYDVQLGFGWSNGVILKFLTMHEDLLNEL